MISKYCESLTRFSRRKTLTVDIHGVKIGSSHPYCLQTMTNTPTSDVGATVEQSITAFRAGSQLVRLTVPSLRDVEFLREIKKSINDKGYHFPLVADVHFNQRIAFEAARVVDKVRINPGNFADSKKFDKVDYTNDEYAMELQRIEEEFVPLLDICKEHHTALRIGTNHGSLSDRIMARFGDTPEGMAESAMEFLRICMKHHFNQVVISMKASNTMVMVQATRLLVAKMNHEGMNYPLHLGVTEAGEGEDGRIKSAVGVGALMADGIGDTIRISLTEPPECELPVAQKLAVFFSNRESNPPIPEIENYPVDPFRFKRRETTPVLNIGGTFQPIVVSDFSFTPLQNSLLPDYFYTEKYGSPETAHCVPAGGQNAGAVGNFAIWPGKNTEAIRLATFISVYADEINDSALPLLKNLSSKVLVINTRNNNGFADQRAAIVRLMNSGIKHPVVLKREFCEDTLEDLQLKAAAELGGLLLDGLADGIWLSNQGSIQQELVVSTAFGILQASRIRMSKTEYISCPSCGRTMFNLQETTRRIREKTAHLKGLKIGIMGCIVNGLGEMADADYGYVGSGIGKVNLYYSKELIKKGISENNAVDELIALIKQKGDWKEPE
ncbi:MAG: (E)-4-hydroxy-3-methylbut-2-enyl-diphosphate synthase [Bacteroidales bacterium]|nr:(E)-4-hydroxy-3-methylbut-2-enyl-diphosphate synthase [Bacteroidales bacterium]